MSRSSPENPPGSKRERTRNRLLQSTQELLRDTTAGALSIRDISRHADVSHATFYNYYPSVEALLENLAMLFAFTHGQLVGSVSSQFTQLDEVFGANTRQTLRVMWESPSYGRYFFDAGLRIDHFLGRMRAHLANDLARGKASGVFSTDTSELTLALVTGSIWGVALGLHRGELAESHIELATERLLVTLGVDAERATSIVLQNIPFQPAPTLPLAWPLGLFAD